MVHVETSRSFREVYLFYRRTTSVASSSTRWRSWETNKIAPGELDQCLEQYVLGFDVEIIRRLVEDEEIVRTDHQLGQKHFGPFTGAQRVNWFVNAVFYDAHAGHDGTH